MLNRIKILCLVTLTLAVSTATFADVVSVEKDGSGNFLTIQDALESLDYNNGVDDTVLIGPGIYDQQITANGDAGADSVRYPNVFNMTPATVQAAFNSHTDNLTLRGSDPNDPPVLLYDVGADKTQQPYGMFPNDPGDFFESSIVHCGNNVTYENVDIRHLNIEYCQNGQSNNTVYDDCLFTMGLSAGAGHDAHFNLNNNIEITTAVDPSIGADGGYTWTNCIWDGLSTTGDGSLHDGDGFYFHGYDSVPGDGQIQNFLQQGGLAASGCIMKNWDSVIFIPRGREQKDRGIAFLNIEDCFSSNLDVLAIFEGAVENGLVNRCVHTMDGRDAYLRFEERSQGIFQDVVVSNNIISGTNTGTGNVRVNTQTNAGTVLQNANYTIVNNTFYGHNNSGIQTNGPAPAAGNSINVLIANNLFDGDGSGTAIGIDHTAAAGATFTLSTNGYFGNGGGDVTGGLTNSGAVTGDPAYAGGVTTVTIPADTGGPIPIQGLNPGNAAYLDAGTQAAYDAVRSVAGDLDVDQTAQTVSGIDIGAQQNQPVSVLDWSVY